MLSRLVITCALLVAGGALVAGCRTADSQKTSQRDESAAETEAVSKNVVIDKEKIESQAHYGTAIIYELQGKSDLALDEYRQSAFKDPSNEALVLQVSQRFLQLKQPEKALEVVTRATALPGTSSGTLFARLGFIYSTLGKPEQAIQANRMAIKKEPRSLPGYQNLYINYFLNKQEKEAMSALAEAAKVPRTDAAFLLGLAELYINFGLQVPAQKTVAFDRALSVLQRAEKLPVTEPSLQLRLADGYNLLGDENKAALLYADLLKHPLDIPYVRENIRAKLTDIYLRERNRTNAVEQLEAIVRDNPTDGQAYYLLGIIAFDDKQYARADEFFSKVLLLKPNYELVYYDLARAQLNSDKPGEALATLVRAREKFQQSFLLEYLTAMAHIYRKEFTNALGYFNAAEIYAHATDTNHLTADFYFQYGAACERTGDFARAEKHLEKCLQLAPNHDEALNYLGYMWADRGEKLNEARGLIERALKVDPKNAAYLDSMGWVLFKLRQLKEALDYQLQAIQFTEEPDAALFDHLGDIYAALGEKDKAREAWQKSIAIEANEVVRKKLNAAGFP